jgi:hypothetical protein
VANKTIVACIVYHQLNGKVAKVGDIEIVVDKTVIAGVTHFPVEREKWSKSCPVI